MPSRGKWDGLGGAGDTMRLEAMAMNMPDITNHPNRVCFEGVLTVVDEASTKPPSGARGHRVLLTRAAAEDALPSLLGMAVGFTPAWDGHDVRRKCGLITEATLVGNQLRVSGHLYGRDFPEVVKQIESSVQGSMGMSYELADAHVADMRAEVWTLTRAIFTGAAVLLREKAAYRDTSFKLRRKWSALPSADNVTKDRRVVSLLSPAARADVLVTQKARVVKWN